MSNIELDIEQTVELLENSNKAANIGVFLYDVETQKVYWNDVLRTIYEVPKNYAPTFDGVFEFIKEPKAFEEIQKSHKKALELGISFQLEHEIVTKKGKNRHIQVTGQPVFIDESCTEIHGTIIDITDRKKTEIEITKQNQHLNLAEKMVEMGYWRWNTVINEETWSDNLYKIFERKKGGKLTYETYLEYVHEDDKAFVIEQIENAFITHDLPDFSHRIVLPNQTLKTIQLKGEVLVNEKQEVIEMVGTCQDITQIKAKEEELVQKNLQLHTAEVISKSGSWNWDLTTDKINWSDNLYNIYNLDKSTVISFDLYLGFVLQEDQDYVIQHFDSIKQNKKYKTSSYRIRLQNGEIKTLKSIGKVITNDQGEVVKIHGTCQDITTTIAKEEELELKNQQLVLSGQKHQIGYWRWNVKTNQENWSEQQCKIFGISPDEELSYSTYLDHIHPEDYEFVTQRVNQAFVDKVLPVYSHRIILKNGTEKVIFVSANVITNDQNEVIEMLGTTQDITETLDKDHKHLKTNQQLYLTERVTKAGAWQWDLNKNELKFTDNLYEFLGIAIGTKLNPEFLRAKIHEDDREAADEVIKTIITLNKPSTFTLRMLHSDDSLRTLEIIAEPVTNKSNRIVEIIGSTHDITNTVHIKQELNEAHELLHFAEHLTHMGYWRYTPETNTVFWSDNLYHMFEWSKDELLSFESYFDRIHPDDQSIVSEKINQSIDDKKFHNYTHRIIVNNNLTKTLQINGKVSVNNKDGQLELLGICLDITDSKSREIELAQKNQQLQIAEKITMIGNWHWNVNTNEVKWSDNMYHIYGHDLEAPLSYETYINYIHKEDKSEIVNKLKACMRDGNFRDATYRIVLKDGQIKTLKSVGKTVTNKKGEVIEMFGTCQDVTENTLREQELIQKNQQLNFAEQMAMIGSWQWNPQTDERKWSDNLYRIYGLTPGTKLTRKLTYGLIHPDDVDFIKAIVKNKFENFEGEVLSYRLQLANGNIRILEVLFEIIRDKNGTIIEIIGTTQDVTESKQRELELKEKNDQLNNAEQIAMVGSWEWQPFKDIYKWSNNMYRIFGLEIGTKASMEQSLRLVHPDDKDRLTKLISEIVDGVDHNHFIYRTIRDDGEIRTLEVRGKIVKEKDGNLVINGTTQDITYHVQKEQQLFQKNQQLNLAEKMALVGSWEWHPQNNIYKWSDNLYRIFGLKPGTNINRDLALSKVHPADIEGLQKNIDSILNGADLQFLTYRIIIAKNITKNLEVRVYPTTDVEGNFILKGTTQDVTDRLTRERELFEKNRQLNEAEQLSNLGSWSWRAETNTYKWSNNLYKMYGLEVGTHIDFKTFINCIHPNDQKYISRIKSDLWKLKNFDNAIHRTKQIDGKIRTIEAKGWIVKNKKGEVIEVLGSSHDITDRLSREQELYQKNKQFNFAEQIAHIGSWKWNVIDNDYKWSDNHYRIYDIEIGHTISPEIIYSKIHPEDVAFVKNFEEQLPVKKEFETIRYRLQLNENTVKTVEVIGNLTFNEKGEITALAGTTQDITQRIQAEQEILEKNQLLAVAENISAMGSWRWNLINNEITWSDNLYEIIGFKPGSRITFKKYLSRVPKEDQKILHKYTNLAIKTRSFQKFSHRIKTAKGKIITLEVLSKTLGYKNGKVVSIVGATRDVTEERQKAIDLVEKNQLLTFVEELVLIGYWRLKIPSGEFVWSDNLYRIFDFEVGIPMNFKTFLERLPGKEKEFLKKQVKKFVKTKVLKKFTHKVLHRNGDIKIIEVVGSVISDAKGKVIEIIGSSQDITEQANRENDLLEKNHMLNLAQEIALIGYWQVDLETDELKWSDNTNTFYAFGKDESKNFETLLKYIHPDDIDLLKSLKKKYAKTKIFEKFTHRVIDKKGEIRTIEVVGTVLTNKKGKATHFIGSSRDITEDVQQKYELQQMNQQLNKAEHLAMMGSFLYQHSNRKFVWSDNSYIIYGFEVGIPMNFEIFLTCIHPDDYKKVTAYLDEIVKTQEFSSIIFRVKHKNGDVRMIETTGKVITNQAGEITEILGTSIDVTEEVRQKEALRQMNQQLNTAEQLALIGSFVYKPGSEEFQWSENAYKVYGFEVGTPMNFELFLSCIHTDDLDIVLNQRFEAITTKKFKTIVHRIIHKNGAIRYIEAVGKVVTNKEGEIIEVVGSGRDVTESVLKENALIEKNQLLNLTQELASVGYWQLNLATGNIVWSDHIDIIYGFEKDELKNYETLLKHIHPEDVGYFKNIKDLFEKTKEFTKFTHRVLYKDGTIKIIEVVGTIITNKDGEPIEFLGSSRDITEEVEQKRELQQMNQQLNKAEHLAMIGSFLYCPKTEKFKWSDNSYRIYGFEVGVPMNFDTFLTCIHPDDYDKVVNHHVEIINSQEFTNLIYRIVHKNGAIRIIEAIGTVIVDKTGEVIEIIGTSRDITDQKKAEDKILETNTRLQENTIELKARNKQLADFNQITSHNLRAPVSNLNTLIELHNEASNAHLKAEFFNKFTTVVDHLTLTLNTLIDSLKIKSTQNQVLQELSLSNELVKTKEILSAQLLKSKAIIRSDFSMVSTVKYHQIYLESIFLNLISNAIKYRSSDRIPEIYVNSYKENGKTIISFKDNGLGIDLKRHGHKLFGLNKIFHRHPEAKGIGLFLTKAQVEAMGGEINVESEVNVGTTFLITINTNN